MLISQMLPLEFGTGLSSDVHSPALLIKQASRGSLHAGIPPPLLAYYQQAEPQQKIFMPEYRFVLLILAHCVVTRDMLISRTSNRMAALQMHISMQSQRTLPLLPPATLVLIPNSTQAKPTRCNLRPTSHVPRALFSPPLKHRPTRVTPPDN